jgi:protein-S-isoprenylcysteine O-methyltransferase Ste14
MSLLPWWKGARGEWYVAIQGGLFLLLVLGPRTLSGFPVWSASYYWLSVMVGGLLLILGGVLSLAGMMKLGVNLTPLPYPKEESILVETGPYRWARHPIYSGVILAAFGWGLWVQGWLTLGYAFLLFIFFDIKSRREERWLSEKFPGYSIYQRRVRKLIPFIY